MLSKIIFPPSASPSRHVWERSKKKDMSVWVRAGWKYKQNVFYNMKYATFLTECSDLQELFGLYSIKYSGKTRYLPFEVINFIVFI